MNIKLMLGDCLERMKEIPDGSVDMVLCDLPYGTIACKWDKIIPFDRLWEEYWRVTKPCSAIVLFGTEPFSSTLRLSAISYYKYDWQWVKSRKNGFVHAKGMPLRETENISVFSKGGIGRKSTEPMTYNPQGVTAYKKKRVNYVKTTSAYVGGHVVGSEYEQEGFGYPTNLLPFNNESPKTQVHPTQKPVALMEYLIRTYTNEGDVVLDNTMGSGTTGVACVNTQRKFIGVEMDEGYFGIAKMRIAQAENERSLMMSKEEQ